MRLKYILLSFPLFILVAFTSCCSGNTDKDSDVVERVMLARRSIRQYTDQRISRDTLDRILNCGINAPNGRNRQAYEIRVVDDPRMVNMISETITQSNPDALKAGAKNIFANATCLIFIAADTTYDMSQVDCGLLGENIMLSAWSMGIGSCCMAHPVRLMKETEGSAAAIKQMRFSPNYNLLFCIAMGYPDESPEAKPRDAEKIQYVDYIHH